MPFGTWQDALLLHDDGGTPVTQDRSQQPPKFLHQDEDHGKEVNDIKGALPVPPRGPLPSFSNLPAAPPPSFAQRVPLAEDTLDEGDDSGEDIAPTETMSHEEAQSAVAAAALAFGAQAPEPAPDFPYASESVDELLAEDVIEEAATQVHEPLRRSGAYPMPPAPSQETQPPHQPLHWQPARSGQYPVADQAPPQESATAPMIQMNQVPKPVFGGNQDTDATVDDLSLKEVRQELQRRGQGIDQEPVLEALDDDDFQDQRTEVLESPFLAKTIAPKLRVIDGPMQGQEFFITGLQASVGRGDTNTTIVADLAMSRNHFELIRHPDSSFVIRDLGSANGTLLNGAHVREASLFHQDLIKAGKSTFVFENEQGITDGPRHVLPSLAPAAHRASSPAHQALPEDRDDRTHLVVFQLRRSTKLFTRIALGAGILCLILMIGLVALSLTESSALAHTATPSQAATAYMRGVEAVKDQEWEQAKGFFEASATADPSLDVSPQLERLGRESAAKRAFLGAYKALEDGEMDQAQALVDTIPQGSVYHAQAKELLADTRRKKVQELLERAQALADAHDPDAARGALTQLLALSPGHTRAKDLLASLEGKSTPPEEEPEATAEKPAEKSAEKSAEEPAEEPEPKRATHQQDKTAPKPVRRAPVDPLEQGRASYKRKRYSSAIRAFKQAGKEGKELAVEVQTVEANWDEGLDAVKTGKWELAISKLEKAKNADNRLGREHSRQINAPLAQAYGKSGLELLRVKDKDKDSYLLARKRLLAGRRLTKSEPSLQELDRSLDRAAKSLYITATNLKRSKPKEAKELAGIIMLITPTSSELNKKAKMIRLDL